ncbi:MAG: nuclease [Acidobacteriales bacterium]|nr:nuclease [Terriglobales bacterium]
MKRFVALALAWLLFVPQGFGWGEDGHRWINRAAALSMPADYPQFMKEPRAIDELEYLGPEPDRWRSPTEPSLKNSQEPDHYIDLELLQDFGPLPVKRYEFMQRLAEFQRQQSMKNSPIAASLTPDKVGMQPWIVAEVWERLIVAFREYRQLKAAGKPTFTAEHTAIMYAGWLGHYVADGSNPMHTSVQYNGWTGANPNGYTTAKTTHSMFESVNVHDNVKPQEIRSGMRVAKALYGEEQAQAGGWQAEWSAYLDYLRESNGLIEQTYKLEKAGGFRGAGTPEGHKFTADRMRAGAQMLADLWYTAWVQSAVPLPTAS